MNNFVTFRNIQHTSGHQPLKGPALGSADKYTALFPLAWLIKPVFHLQIFSYEAPFSKLSLVSDLFRRKKVRSNPTFCFRTKNVASNVKIRKWKTSVKIKYVNKNSLNELSNASNLLKLL